MHAVPAVRDADQGGLRRRERRRRPDVRRRGPGGRGGPPGAPVRGPSRAACSTAPRGDRADPRGRVHRQRPQVPASRQPRPAAGRDRVVPALPGAPGRADRAAGDRDAGQLRDQAAHRQPDRDHQGARHARRSTSSAGARCSCCRSSIRRPRCGRPRWSRRCARTSRRCRELLEQRAGRAWARRGARSPAPRRAWPSARRPTSSASSVDRADRPRRRAETEAHRRAASPPGCGPATSCWSRGELGQRQDHAGARRLPRARRRRAGDLARRSRSAGATRAALTRSPTSTSTGSTASGRGARAARRLPDARRDLVRRVAGGDAATASPLRPSPGVRVAARVELRHAGGDAREISVEGA